MSPKKKDKNFPHVRVTEELRNETIECAKIEDEYYCDYIRKAVEIRNKKVKKGGK
jgi:Arc/MetJ family transcription regulator